jgi:hypothetical protein
MVSILNLLVASYIVLGSAGLIAFMRAARHTNDDWEQHPSARRWRLALMQAEQVARGDGLGNEHFRADRA